MKAVVLSLAVMSLMLINNFAFGSDNPGVKNDNKPEYRIQLCSFTNSAPISMVEKLRNVDGVKSIKDNGSSVYLSQAFDSQEDANSAIASYKEMGFDNATAVTVVDNTIQKP
ncbi:hypothetical protein K6119_04960 [Paracrocinitomix mangrovi]|uniref:hypothetical protein n=1 Tax=Paracrocinitomix mangrovi TaxID=2862509 RepID=UPI001C8E443D|nr:hypothetical protein [Paracrocinitomix mangrovi]UKN02863.1 hypothetical protein K6119_04960 [Paracrocinitomix mangrovi]